MSGQEIDMTLTEFLLARIAEDEAVARAAGPDWVSSGKIADYGMDDDTAEHVLRFSPARVLAECEAKRAIVEWADDGWRDPALEALALPYDDHPDYLPEWKP